MLGKYFGVELLMLSFQLEACVQHIIAYLVVNNSVCLFFAHICVEKSVSIYISLLLMFTWEGCLRKEKC